MEGYSHDSVGVVEGLLHAITVMDIDIQIEHSRVDLQQFEDADDDIVDVAEPTGFGLLGVMVPAGPIDSNVRDAGEDDIRCVDAASRGQLAEVVEPIKAWTIEALVDFEERLQFGIIPDLPLLIFLILRDDLVLLARHPLLEVLDVGLVVEEAEFILGGFLALEHDEVVVEIVGLDEGVRHLDTLGLHGVLLAEVVVRDRVVVQVAYLTHCLGFDQLMFIIDCDRSLPGCGGIICDQ